MATYNKFQNFVEDLIEGVHDFDAHTVKIYLSNAAPSASGDLIKTDMAEISAGNGYSAGGGTTGAPLTTSETTGTAKAVGSDVTTTASGGSVGPFQYAVLFNDTPSSPLDPLIAWWDYGSAVTLLTTETFTVDLDPTNGIFTVA